MFAQEEHCRIRGQLDLFVQVGSKLPFCKLKLGCVFDSDLHFSVKREGVSEWVKLVKSLSRTCIVNSPVCQFSVPGSRISLCTSVVTTVSIFADLLSTALTERVFKVESPNPFTELQKGLLKNSSRSWVLIVLTWAGDKPNRSPSSPKTS